MNRLWISSLSSDLQIFGMQAKCLETGEIVAIKKVLQDRRYKNRELQIMRVLDHSNVVQLKHCFFSTTEKDEVYLNLVLEYISETVYRASKHYVRMNQHVPIIFVQLYAYQVNYCWINWFSVFVMLFNVTVCCTGWGNLFWYSGFSPMQICRALNYLHNVVDVCHRDIKPQNLLVRFVSHPFCHTHTHTCGHADGGA